MGVRSEVRRAIREVRRPQSQGTVTSVNPYRAEEVSNNGRVFAELNERGDRMAVYFRYDEGLVRMIKTLPGARFVPPEKGGPYWSLPLDLDIGRQLRDIAGKALSLGDALTAWGKEQVARERNLGALATADDWPLEELKVADKLPELAEELLAQRAYQRADVKYLSTTSALNLLEPRLGKTIETIAAIFEGDLEDGPHLVIAPQKACDSVWRMEWERWADIPVYVYTGETKMNDRAKALAAIERHLQADQAFVLCTTADMIRRGLPDDLDTGIEWNTITIDEFHKTGLPETKNVFPKKAGLLRAKRKYALSGTPMGGKPIKIWGALHWLDPKQHPSKWRWADQWLVVTPGYQNHKVIGGIKPGREESFYRALAPYAVRRLREEVLPQLPPIQHVDVWCDMTEKQRIQYVKFHTDAEIRIDEYHLSATNILAEYTRLKQFSNARCTVEIISEDEETGWVEMKVKPTFDSGKLAVLLEKLAESGIDPDEPWGNSQAIVASQFRETTDMVYNWLNDQGIKCVRITGKVSKEESELAQRVFKAENDSDGYRVCCMVTTLGVGITMDNVETVHMLDETWSPDDQTQLIDRAVNTTSNHQVTAFTYRSKDSIEQYIQNLVFSKREMNKKVLDSLRQQFRGK
jgi:Zierdtviridae DNA helicase